MRASGILLPVFSLPGEYGIGCFSKEAYRFVDFLVEAGQKYWQMLPVGPTSYGDSPYQSFSVYAGNPYFISLEELIEQGFLTKEECDKADFGKAKNSIDYGKLYLNRFPILKKAYTISKAYENEEFVRFCSENAFWLEDYALFMALKDFFGGKSFTEWPEDIRRRYGYSMDYYRRELYFDIEFYKFLQYEFNRQWRALKTYANEKGISIIGDIPIYVAPDSADVWAHPELFRLDEDGKPTEVAGCPPDGFSATGQLWGNPIYNWDYHRSTDFDWWNRRIAKCRELYDIIRIDHFRGFDEYFSIPAGHETAEHGVWKKGPGMELFSSVKRKQGEITIVAEDLGFITDSVRQLVKDSGFPNMKVLEFAFDAREPAASEYLPFNYNKNCVVYTGTHDNETLRGWLSSILPEEREMVRDYLGTDSDDEETLCKGLIRIAFSSVADYCILPMQDWLMLGNEARINTPSVLGGNWTFRLTKNSLTKKLAKEIRSLTEIYGRL